MAILEAVWFEEPLVGHLMEAREKARKNRRLTYDCMAAVTDGDVVKCRHGYKFLGVGKKQGGGMSLLSALRGRSSGRCQKCEEYDKETVE